MAEEAPTTGEHQVLGPMEFIDVRTGERMPATTGELVAWEQSEAPQPPPERLDFMEWKRRGGLIRPSLAQRRPRWWQRWRRPH